MNQDTHNLRQVESQETIAVSASQVEEDACTSARATVLPDHIVELLVAKKKFQLERESHTAVYSRYNVIKRASCVERNSKIQTPIANESENNLQPTSTTPVQNDLDRDPIFVLVGSRSLNNPSSNEIITKTSIQRNNTLPNKLKRSVLPIDLPCTSREMNNPYYESSFFNSESNEELPIIDINLQSENDFTIEEETVLDEDEDSIVMAYLKNRDKMFNNEEGQIRSTKKKSSLLEDVPKMETIPEGEKFYAFSSALHISRKVSENSLDVYIPSFPGTPRSLSYSSAISEDSEDHRNPLLAEAIEFLHHDREFLVAAETGNDQLLEILIRRGTYIQQVDHLGRNALHFAVCVDNLRSIEILLNAGVDPNVKDSVGMTPLSLCLMRRPLYSIAAMLFKHGAKIVPRSNPMDTGLFIQFVMMCTPTHQDSKILQLLVDEGALINDPEAPGGRQALHFAAMSNNCQLIKVLMELGANLLITNHRNETPRDVAATFKCVQARDLLSEYEKSQNVSHITLHNNKTRILYFTL